MFPNYDRSTNSDEADLMIKRENTTNQETESLLERAKHAYKQTMPEALGGGYPVQAGIIKDEHGNIISGEKHQTKPVLDQVKDQVNSVLDPTKYIAAKITANESRPYVDQSKKAQIAAEKARLVAEKAHNYEDHAKSRTKVEGGQPKIIRDGAGDISLRHTQKQTKRETQAPTMTNKPIHETTIKETAKEIAPVITHGAEEPSSSESESLLDHIKHTYKQAMPESLGGGYPVQAGIIKDENGNIISGEKIKFTLAPTEKSKAQDHITKATTKVRTKKVHTKEEVHDAAEQAKSHLQQAKDEVKLAIEKAKPHLAQAAAEAMPHLQRAMTHMKEAGEQGKPYLEEALVEVKKSAAGYIDQLINQLAQVDVTVENEEEISLEKTKDHIKEAAKELKSQLEKGTESVDESKKEAASNKPFLEKAKIAYRENMPEILGGRPTSIPEAIGIGLAKEVQAEKEYQEARKFEQLPPENQSFLDKVKHNYKEAMPSLLGGRPLAVSEIVQKQSDNLKKEAQEEVDNIKSSLKQGNLKEHVKERAEEVVREHMPESLGGRPPTFGEKVKTGAEKAIVKNRVNAMLNGTLEQIENHLP